LKTFNTAPEGGEAMPLANIIGMSTCVFALLHQNNCLTLIRKSKKQQKGNSNEILI
jgi:hypothetical protein